MAEEIDTLIPHDEAVDLHPLVSGQSFHGLQKLIFQLELRLDPQSSAAKQLGDARESIGLARRAFEFDAANGMDEGRRTQKIETTTDAL